MYERRVERVRQPHRILDGCTSRHVHERAGIEERVVQRGELVGLRPNKLREVPLNDLAEAGVVHRISQIDHLRVALMPYIRRLRGDANGVQRQPAQTRATPALRLLTRQRQPFKGVERCLLYVVGKGCVNRRSLGPPSFLAHPSTACTIKASKAD